MGKVIVVTESIKGDRLHLPGVLKNRAVLVSTQGNSVIDYKFNHGYTVNAHYFDSVLNALDPPVVYIGTDLDRMGTLVGTLVKNYLAEKGIPALRLAYTAQGYTAIGGFMTKEQVKVCEELSMRNIQYAGHMKRAVGNFHCGYETAVGIKQLLHAEPVFPRKSDGHNTVTYATNALLAGVDGVARLDTLYSSGHIVYPRVDCTYNDDNPMHLYPHPPLDSRGYEDGFMVPMPEEIKLSPATAPLYLNGIRLMPPTGFKRIYHTASQLFNDDMSVNPQYNNAVEYIDNTITDDDYAWLVGAYDILYSMLPVVWIRNNEIPTSEQEAEQLAEMVENAGVRENDELVLDVEPEVAVAADIHNGSKSSGGKVRWQKR